MVAALLGKKIGMTRVYTPEGVSVPVTVIQAGPCPVLQVKKTDTTDGYNAIQLGFEDVKPHRSTLPMIGHAGKAGTGPKRFVREIRVEVVKTDFFGRLVGRVFVEGRDAGLAQLRAGLAWHFRRYDADLAPAQRRRYAEAERQARLRRLGLWREAAPVPPWEYRAQARRSHSPPSAPAIDPRTAQ